MNNLEQEVHTALLDDPRTNQAAKEGGKSAFDVPDTFEEDMIVK